MTLEQLKQLDDNYVAPTYARTPLAVVQGSGATVKSDAGKPLIDFSAGIGVSAVGYANPKWAEAVKGQIDKLAHMSNLYYTQPMLELAKALCGRTGLRRVFFGNSGAEANEGAIKAARKYMSAKYPGARDTIVTLQNSFHGRTIATLAATGQESFHKDFGPFPAGFAYAEANSIADLTAKLAPNVGAVMIECVQGEGGVIALGKAFVKGVAALCEERDLVLICDEVQAGMGRTGKLMSYEHYGILPDIVTLAKGLGGGLPIGAVLFGEKTKEVLGKGDHGSTFGGNPVCCAGALAVLDIIDEVFLEEVAEKGGYLRQKLQGLPGVAEVSGMGMMLGAALADGLDNAEIARECAAQGLVILTAKKKLRLLPPLTITGEEIDAGLAILQGVLAAKLDG